MGFSQLFIYNKYNRQKFYLFLSSFSFFLEKHWDNAENPISNKVGIF